MRTFAKTVNLDDRNAMIAFLYSHPRYYWGNGARPSSYAHNVKVYSLGLSSEQEEMLYEMLGLPEFQAVLTEKMSEFASAHNYLWQAGFNGRSNGYLVLYQGEKRLSGYKSKCTDCGGLNYKTVEETHGTRCGYCGSDGRVNLSAPHYQSVVYPYKGTDVGEEFEEWSTTDLQSRVKLVCEFDELCDEILSAVVKTLEEYEVAEEEILVPKTIKTIKRRTL